MDNRKIKGPIDQVKWFLWLSIENRKIFLEKNMKHIICMHTTAALDTEHL